VPYHGRLPQDAGSADEFLHLTAAKAHREAEDARKAAQKARWAQEDSAREKAAVAAKTARQQERDAELKSEIRARFMSANPAASEEDFRRLLPSFRDAEMIQRARDRTDEEVSALRSRLPGL